MTRYITALVLLPIVLYLIFWAQPYMLMLFVLLIQFFGQGELNRIFHSKGIRPLRIQAFVYTFLFSLSALYYRPELYSFIFYAMVFTVFMQKMLVKGELTQVTIDVPATFFSVFYLGILGSYVVLLRSFKGTGELGPDYVAMLLTIVWLGDTGAYQFGKAFGKHKFAPVLSPNKTWEGFFGGLLTSVLLGFFARWLMNLDFPAIHVVPAALIIGFIGHMGDMVESILKRSVQIKDSGTLFPGHGGALDRIDSVFFAAPAFYYYCLWVIG